MTNPILIALWENLINYDDGIFYHLLDGRSNSFWALIIKKCLNIMKQELEAHSHLYSPIENKSDKQIAQYLGEMVKILFWIKTKNKFYTQGSINVNEGLKLENINKLFEKFELPDFNSSSVIYGCIHPKLWKFALYQGLAALDIKHFLIYFDSNEIILVGLTLTGDLTNNVIRIPMTSISNLKFKKGWINNHFEFTTSENKRYPFKVPKFVLIAKWQKPNLANIMTTYFNQ